MDSEIMREKVETMAQYKILVVDDNADILDLLEILLTSEGYAVTLASSGEQALQLLSPELDLVILDIMMPGISGIRVCEAIRKVRPPMRGASFRRRTCTRACGTSRTSTLPTAPSWCISASCGSNWRMTPRTRN